jgi:ABC-type lipoprotein export system ATPase subunit
MVKADPYYGTFIIHSSLIFQQLGPECGFFRAHEIGHVVSRHHLLPPYAYNSQVELQADYGSHRTAFLMKFFAAYQLF